MIPTWALKRPKNIVQTIYDFIFAPLRMVFLPDASNEKIHLTSLRAERFSVVIPELRGRVLDVGAGDNSLLKAYIDYEEQMGVDTELAKASIGVDVIDWGEGCTLVKSSAHLPFEDNSFDTVSFIACINHIPERKEALIEAARVLKPNGRILITMINRFLGELGHKLWWYSEDKHRHVDENELMGMDPEEIKSLLESTGFRIINTKHFVYGLNCLYIAEMK